MTVAVRRTSCAPGIWLSDVLCNAGPDDPTFEEWHATACVAFVTQGGFGYRCSAGSAALGPGAVLLGNARSAYTCTHAAPGGDRCLSFSYSLEVVEDAAACAGGPARFRRGALPAAPAFAALPALASSAAEGKGPSLEEVALGLVTGYFGGIVDDSLMRLVDAFLALPLVILGLLFLVALGPSTIAVILVIVTMVPIQSHVNWLYWAGMGIAGIFLLYHTGKEKAIVGVMKAVATPRRDPESDDPKAVTVEVRFAR